MNGGKEQKTDNGLSSNGREKTVLSLVPQSLAGNYRF